MDSLKNRALLIGSVGAGKTSLTFKLLGRKVEPRKTQSLHFYDWIIDSPGEYLENPMFYKSIMVTALEVTHILFIYDATKEKIFFPPSFSTGMNKLTIGVVTKCDHKDADIKRAQIHLKKAMQTGPIVCTSSVSGQGIEELKGLIHCSNYNEMRKYITGLKQHVVTFHN
ncbi:EutP/PduV family microcompartment system protein [Bacillus sp. FJAT-45350]|uniref:EutP/PduV family microcompartment system protein n=1 Tax=Bacillus sp. FJAT-45350 TaxID=2011014 RepID=UPI0027BA689F|nr:EutP/PduV family microcompartment system protein [Bacillus sp. FJAT-45350]